MSPQSLEHSLEHARYRECDQLLYVFLSIFMGRVKIRRIFLAKRFADESASQGRVFYFAFMRESEDGFNQFRHCKQTHISVKNLFINFLRHVISPIPG